MLARLMGGDFEAIARRSRAVTELLTEGREAHVTCPHGTDMRFELGGRAAISDDGDLRERAAFGNLPCGEAFIAPAGGEGRVVVSSIATLGMPEDPVELVVRDGRLSSAGGAAGRRLLQALDAHGERGRNLAELGVGTNDRATLTGNVLEDEKILGTVHLAFGASIAFGGTVAVPVHIDAVVLEPTLTVDATTVIDAGRFVL
jgi:leucyl aminopeptidase (aminopeptidase T)